MDESNDEGKAQPPLDFKDIAASLSKGTPSGPELDFDPELDQFCLEKALIALDNLRPLLDSQAIENQLELPPEALVAAKRMISDIYDEADAVDQDLMITEVFRGQTGQHEAIGFTVPLRVSRGRNIEEVDFFILSQGDEVVAANLTFVDKKLAKPQVDLLKALGRRTSDHGLHFTGGAVLQVCLIFGEEQSVIEDHDLLVKALASSAAVRPAGFTQEVVDRLPDKAAQVLVDRGVSLTIGAKGEWRDPDAKIEYLLQVGEGTQEVWKRFPGFEPPGEKPVEYFGRINRPPDFVHRRPERRPAPREPRRVRKLKEAPVGVKA